jgi:hypothetical protein
LENAVINPNASFLGYLIVDTEQNEEDKEDEEDAVDAVDADNETDWETVTD